MKRLVLFIFVIAAGQNVQAATSITFSPPNPQPGDTVAMTIRGTWRDSCVPRVPAVSVVGRTIRIEAATSPCPSNCLTALTSYSVTTTVMITEEVPSPRAYAVEYYTVDCVTGTVLDTTQQLIVSPRNTCRLVETLCLNGNRFEVTARWRTPDGSSGTGRAVSLTDGSGYFWFFDPTNAEIVMKVLDVCGTSSPSFWVFMAGMTNVQVDLNVRDTRTNTTRTYSNPQGKDFAPIYDTSAFKTCP